MRELINKINGNIFMTKTLPNGEEIQINNKNTLTTLFENTILGTVIGGLFSSNSGSEAGLAMVNTPQRYKQTSQSYKMKSILNNNFVIYLLNLNEDELSALNKDMSKNPIVKNDGTIDDTKVIGYATFNYIGDEGKRGTLTPQKPVYTLNHNQYGVSFNWTAGRLSGTVNCIMIGSNVMENRTSAVTLSKGLDFNNPIIGESPADGHYLTNNVTLADGTVITGPNEILLGNGTNATLARRVLNLLTGESQDLDSTDIRYGAYLFNVPHKYIGEGRIVQNIGNTVSVVNYNRTNTSLNKVLLSSNARGFAVHNNNIYVLYTSTYDAKLQIFDIETLSTSTSNDIPLTFPAEFGTPYNNWALSEFLDKFMFINIGTNVSTFPTNLTARGYIFTDITSPFTSYAGGYSGFIGSNLELIDENESLTEYIYLTEYQISNFCDSNVPDNVTAPSGLDGNVSRNGVKYIVNGYNGQVLTYSKLDIPITFDGTENFRIDYMFNF